MNQYPTHPVTGETWDEIPPQYRQAGGPDSTALGLADVEDEIPGEDPEAEAQEVLLPLDAVRRWLLSAGRNVEREPRYRTRHRWTTRHPFAGLLAWTVVAYVIFHIPGVAAVLYWFFFSYLL